MKIRSIRHPFELNANRHGLVGAAPPEFTVVPVAAKAIEPVSAQRGFACGEIQGLLRPLTRAAACTAWDARALLGERKRNTLCEQSAVDVTVYAEAA